MPGQPPRLFDRRLAALRRDRAIRAHGETADFLLHAAAADLVDRLAAVSRRFELAAEIGACSPVLAERLLAGGQVAQVVRLGRSMAASPAAIADIDALPLRDAGLDLAVSALALQASDDLPGALAQIRRALKPDGLFLAAFLGGETLIELRQAFAVAEEEVTGGASPRVSPFVELRTAGALLQRAGFALPVIDTERRVVRYAGPLDLMRDLRAAGATNILRERSRKPLRRAVLARAIAVYQDRFADADGRVRATFEVISLSGWAPHASQPKPLRPGSAGTRLADALKAAGRSAGEKAGR